VTSVITLQGDVSPISIEAAQHETPRLDIAVRPQPVGDIIGAQMVSDVIVTIGTVTRSLDEHGGITVVDGPDPSMITVRIPLGPWTSVLPARRHPVGVVVLDTATPTGRHEVAHGYLRLRASIVPA
jgi:hypothetical protein